jgi:hypothetical protein
MEDREKLIQEKIKEQEFIEVFQHESIRAKTLMTLIKEKEFAPEEIEIDPIYRLILRKCEADVSIDFVINISEISFMAIRCVSTAIESWERYIIAFCRAVKEYQIPYAMVTDGENAKVLDVLSGSLVSESVDGIFNRQKALDLLRYFKKIPCPDERIEKEKKIVYAFESIKCPREKLDD